MLATASIEAALADFEFRLLGVPFSFAVYETPYEGQWLRIGATAPNSYRPAEPIVLDIHTAIPPVDSTRAFIEWLVYRLCRIGTHEVREGSRYRGQLWSDPHQVDAFGTRATIA